MDEIPLRVIQKLVDRRKELGFTQEELSQMCGLSRINLARIETGKVCPRIDTIVKIAETLGMQLDVEKNTQGGKYGNADV